MESIKEFITQLFQSPEMIALISAAVTWIGANLFTIIMFAVKYIKLKNKEIKDKLKSEQTIAALTEEYNAKINMLCSKIEDKLNSVDKHITQKVGALEEERKAQIKQSSLELEKAIAEAKSALKVDQEA